MNKLRIKKVFIIIQKEYDETSAKSLRNNGLKRLRIEET